MERVEKFLKEAETYYLATVEGDQPRVRPFGTAHIFEGKLYIQTGKVKEVSKQIHANPKVEICAFKNGEWLRVAGELVEDDRREARQSMLDAYPSLQKMYSADDGNTEVFYFKNATATFSSFTHDPELFERLDNSKFRSSFHLKQKDIDYINQKGLDTIRQHAKDFIAKREAPAFIANDGKQTPMRGHPVFIAQHATATCCRECIRKWHKMQPGRELSQVQQDYLVDIIMTWIQKELERQKKKL